MHRAARQLGIRLIESLLDKVAALSPFDQMIDNARYGVGMERLSKELGIGTDPTAQMAALAENEEYAKRLRGLWDKHVAPYMAPAPAARAAAITEENAPKVLQTPK